MIPADDIVRRAGILLLDEEHVRWSVSEILDWAVDGASSVVSLNHAAGATPEEIELEEGVFQSVDALEVMDVVRVLPNGEPIQRTDRYMLDASDPGWYARKPTEKIVHYCRDDRDIADFYVYPPAKAGTKVEALVARIPERPEKGGTLEINAKYMDAIINYVAYRAFAKDSEFANGQVSVAYYNAFLQGIGATKQAAMEVSPNMQARIGGEE